MSLGGSSILFQIDRTKLLGLIQEWVPLQSQAIVAPFALRTKTKASVIGPSLPSLDVLVDQVDLVLTPGGDRGHLALRLHVGILRLGGSSWVISGGSIKVNLQFVRGTLLLVRKLDASFDGLQAQGGPVVANFDALANTEANHLLDDERNQETELFPDEDTAPNPLKMAAILGGVHNITDAETFTTLIGAPDGASVARLIQPGRSVVLAQSANLIKTQLLQPALAAQLLNPNDPTADLPPPWGAGKIGRDQDDVHVDITRLDVAFEDGYLDLSGKFDAHNDCWSVSDGSFSQQLFLDFIAGAGTAPPRIVPRLEPASPNVTYDVDIDFLCRLVEFAVGVALGLAGAFIYGVAVIVVMEVIKASVNPAVPGIPAPAVPLTARLGGVYWESLRVIPEGAIMQGGVLITLPATDPVTPLVYLKVINDPQMTGTTTGKVTVQAPTCAARQFEYSETFQRDDKTVRVQPRRMIEPVDYAWSINGTPLTVQNGVLKYSSTIVTALPPPNGTSVPGHTIELGYEIGIPAPVRKITSIIGLSPRAADGNYSIQLKVAATDAVGQYAGTGITLNFVGDKLEMRDDYTDYMNDCLQHVVDIADAKGKKSKRPQPGDPLQLLPDLIARIADHVQLGNTQAAHEAATAAVRAHGLEAVSQALAVKLRG